MSVRARADPFRSRREALGSQALVAEPQAPPPTERAGWNWKVILLLALAVYAILLIIQNRKTVSVDFVVFTEKTRVVWLVLLSIGIGALIIWLLPRLRRRGRKSRKDPEKEPRGVAGVSWRVILIAALAIYAVLLIVFNSKTVSVDFVFVTEKTRVIWLVLLSVALGALIMWLLPRIRRQRKSRAAAG